VPSRARTIIELPLVERRVREVSQEYLKFSDVFEYGVKWRLARDPFDCSGKIPNTNPQRYFLKTFPWRLARIPAFRLVYHITDNEVIVEALAIFDD
jgi:hypothetical protein